MTWQAATQALKNAGGGPVGRVEFWPPSIDGEQRGRSLTRARTLGLMVGARKKYGWTWKLTERGEKWAAGELPDPRQKPAELIDRETLIRRLTFGVDDALQRVSRTTDRQREIMVYVASGLSSREIAELMNRAVKTVERHRARMMENLGCDKVAEVAVLAAKAGLV